MATPKFLKPFVTKEALIGWAIAFHQKIWRLVELGGDVDFIAAYADEAWAFFDKTWIFFSADWGTWLVVIFGLGLVGHSYFRHSKGLEEKPAEEEKPSEPERKYVSPFSGKTPAPPGPVPQRFIDLIDGDDQAIAGRIRFHAITKCLSGKKLIRWNRL